MVRKTTGFTAAIAAAVTLTFVGMDSSGANAQVAANATPTTASEAPLTEEVVPVFVEKEVVQELPEEARNEIQETAEEPRAQNLRQLVAAMPATGELSAELQCLAGAIYFESRGEPLSGQLAVAQVIINRSQDGRFPSSYCGVVYQRSQFSFVKGGRMPHIRTSSTAWRNAKAIARIAHRGLWDSEAGEALYFHAKYVKPSWSRKKVATATIDTHVFYR
ncbi:cell wall hydrolase [Qipengyuania soli]|uniref:Cell wall hydrolase n=1 Tax=Qipengyuania soli TaxID=2782568 RepID=A0A7S8F3Z2_9SPHN|nr:cell wall hydrolase [Qipengyuania soli]QPC98711.1 cell wall hydrolase [Qipengyuania soli]